MSRILHVVHGYYPESGGGTEAYVRSLLEAQATLGDEVLLLHGSFEPRPEPCLERREGLPCRAWRLHRADSYSDFWDKAHYAPARDLVLQLVEDEKPDLVHLHQWIRLSDDLVSAITSRGLPCVVSLHDLYSSCPACFRLRPDDSHCEREVSWDSCHDCVPLRGHESRDEVSLAIEYYRANMRHELSSASVVLAATEATASLITSGLGLLRERVTLLPLGYEPRFAELEVTRPMAAEAAAPLRLAYWGNVTARKGVQTLIKSLRVLGERRAAKGVESALGESIELHVFGRCDSDELDSELRELADGLPVTLHGRYEWNELAELGVDLACFPSTCFETYGFVLDEAFELGVPALVTDVGAFGERLRGAGFLVPPADVEALADTIQGVLEDRGQLSAAAARIPGSSPSPAAHAKELAALYEFAAGNVLERDAHQAAIDSLDAMRERLVALRHNADRDTAPAKRGVSV